MNKKMIGYALWVFAILVPFRMLYLNEMRPTLASAAVFILMILCLGVGAWMFASPLNQTEGKPE